MNQSVRLPAPDGVRPGVLELIAFSVVGSLKAMAYTLRHRLALRLLFPAWLLSGVLAAALGLWWLVPAGVLLTGAAGCLAAVGAQLLALGGWRGRRLLWQRGAAGRASLTAQVCRGRGGAAYVRAWNFMALPDRGAPRLDREQRPGALLLGQAVAVAHAHALPVRFQAASKQVAEKVYLPAGCVYADPGQRQSRRPWMVLDDDVR